MLRISAAWFMRDIANQEEAMQNAEGNPTQAQQNEIAAKSPVKTPAAGIASPDVATLEREFGSAKEARSAEPHEVRNVTPLPAIDLEPETVDTADPVARAASRIVSVDSAGMAASDSTVDTDGKTAEARRALPEWHDNTIWSNATPENYVPTPAWGLAGFDSRATGSLPAIAPQAGYRVVFVRRTYEQRINGSRGEQLIRFERTDTQHDEE